MKLKFRCWNGEQMINPDYIDRDGIAWWKENSIPTNSNNVMMWTGLLDKWGKDIYKGDIVKQTAEAYYDENHIDKTYIGEVVILASKGTCLKKPKCKNNLTGSTYNVDYYVNVAQYRSEVIGNIYENPELI